MCTIENIDNYIKCKRIETTLFLTNMIFLLAVKLAVTKLHTNIHT